MRIIVIGSGVIGVTSAWYLSNAGHEVTVIDRQESPARETSFANGGQISVGQAEPWANPAAPLKILKWLGREDAPLLFRLRSDLNQWSWALKFLIECLPSRTEANTLTCLRLANYSRDKLRQLRGDIGISYDDLQKGILTLHTDEQEFQMACNRVELFRNHGVQINIKTPEEIQKLEPTLQNSRVDLVGGTHAVDDESGDAFLFTERLAEFAKKRGVGFGFGVEAVGFLFNGKNISGLATRFAGREEILSADAYVVAMGSYSPTLLSKIGIHVPIYPVKGYSVTIPIRNPDMAPTVCITDENAKIAMSKLGSRLRAAGTAELTGYNLAVRNDRCDSILARVKSFFPEAGEFENARRWAGLRPMVPNNIPLIGRTKFSNLYLNTGQGTLGWTLACGSAAGLANVVNGSPQDIDFPFL